MKRYKIESSKGGGVAAYEYKIYGKKIGKTVLYKTADEKENGNENPEIFPGGTLFKSDCRRIKHNITNPVIHIQYY